MSRGLFLATCSHVLCSKGRCSLEAIGPLLPRYVKVAGKHWTKFNDLYYLYVNGKPDDVASWRELQRVADLVAVTFTGAPDLGAPVEAVA